MKLKSLTKGLLVTAALTLAIVATPASSVRAEGAQGTYTVEKNDNLSKIAKKVYGNEKMWKVIYDANSWIIKSDYIIYTGQVLAIPGVNDNSAPVVTTPAATTEAAPAAATTPAPEAAPAAATTPATPAAAQENEFTLDYNQIASWVTGGFVGISSTNEAVIMGTDAENDYGIIIFADDDTMTAASFVGPITYAGDYMTITDEANGLALTVAVTDNGDGTLGFGMGDLGSATVSAQAKDVVLSFIKIAIEGYTHVA